MQSLLENAAINVTVAESLHPDKPHILASASVELVTDLGRITLNDFRIFRGRDNQVYFAAPTVRAFDANGQPQWLPVVELSPELERRVYDEAQRVCESLPF